MAHSHDVDRKKALASNDARLRALDAMLGGIAHDLNNALSVVLMNLDVMQQDKALTAKHGRRIDGMLDAMTGASNLVRYLLSFSHARDPEPDILSLSETLPPLVELLEAAVGREIDVVINASDAGPCCVTADIATLEVTLVHAAMQLAAAMHGGGTITFDLTIGDLTIGDPATGAPSSILLVLTAMPRDDVAVEASDLDLEYAAVFARDLQGTVTHGSVSGGGYQVSLSLPACAEATTL